MPERATEIFFIFYLHFSFAPSTFGLELAIKPYLPRYNQNREVVGALRPEVYSWVVEFTKAADL